MQTNAVWRSRGSVFEELLRANGWGSGGNANNGGNDNGGDGAIQIALYQSNEMRRENDMRSTNRPAYETINDNAEFNYVTNRWEVDGNPASVRDGREFDPNVNYTEPHIIQANEAKQYNNMINQRQIYISNLPRRANSPVRRPRASTNAQLGVADDENIDPLYLESLD